jgi:mono/diheme cytochrome c family protein
MKCALVLTLSLGLSACDWSLQRMVDQERCQRDKASGLFPNGSCNQAPPEGVVRYQGPALASSAPSSQPVDAPGLERGRERFELFCGPCHGLTGHAGTQVGENMQLRPPPSLHEPRIVALPDDDILRAIEQGYGLMPSYARALNETERRQVAAYVRVLQRSQRVELDALPPEIRTEAQRWLR